VQLLSNARDHLETMSVTDMDKFVTPFARPAIEDMTSNGGSSGGKEEASHVGYFGLLAYLQDYLKGDLDYKSFEACCRTLSKTNVHNFVVLPKLIDKCSDMLGKVSREGFLLPLFELSHSTTRLVSTRWNMFAWWLR